MVAKPYIDSKKPSKPSAEAVKREVERDIHRMDSWHIIKFLTYRHRVGLLAFGNIMWVVAGFVLWIGL